MPIQGSGTFAVEAQLGTLVPRDGHLLILVGGAYGRRMVEICRRMGRAHSVLETDETVPPTASALAERLAAEPDITDVALVHCETTTGILNPLADLAAAVSEAGRRLHVDAMSSFGGIPIDLGRLPLTSLAASANKCLEGAPGMGFVIVRAGHLAGCADNAHAVSLDLHAQWAGLEANGQWRFTPPTHILAALDRALDALDDEGGVAGRFARYWENCRTLVDGMRGLGFETLLGRCRAGADHRDLPRTGRSRLGIRDVLRPARGAGIRDLSRQARAGGELPRRLHRRLPRRHHGPLRRGGGGRAARDGRAPAARHRLPRSKTSV